MSAARWMTAGALAPGLSAMLALGACDLYFGLGGSKLPTAAQAREIAVDNIGYSFERRGCRVRTELLPDTFAGASIPYTPKDARIALKRMTREGLIREEGKETVYLAGNCRPAPPGPPNPGSPQPVAPRPQR